MSTRAESPFARGHSVLLFVSDESIATHVSGPAAFSYLSSDLVPTAAQEFDPGLLRSNKVTRCGSSAGTHQRLSVGTDHCMLSACSRNESTVCRTAARLSSLRYSSDHVHSGAGSTGRCPRV